MLKEYITYDNRVAIYGMSNFSNKTFFHIKLTEALNERFGEDTPIDQKVKSVALGVLDDGKSKFAAVVKDWSKFFGIHCEIFTFKWEDDFSNRLNAYANRPANVIVRSKELAHHSNFGIGFWDKKFMGVPLMNNLLEEEGHEYVNVVVPE